MTKHNINVTMHGVMQIQILGKLFDLEFILLRNKIFLIIFASSWYGAEQMLGDQGGV